MNKLQALKEGDTIGIISPGSSPNKDMVLKAVENLKSLGFKIKLGKNYLKHNGFLAGTDAERVEDLHQLFLDSSVKAIICTRGGYGSARLSPYINREIIKNNPKIFIGYSDITYLHLIFNTQCQLPTFHGPMCQPEWGQQTVNAATYDSLETLMNQIEWSIPNTNYKTIVSGLAEGWTIGGNLTVFLSSFGTYDEPDLTDKIIFLEEIGEDPYRIDRMLNQLYISKKWEAANGFILGSFIKCIGGKHQVAVEEVLDSYFKKMNKPTIMNVPVGHMEPNYLFPLNYKISMNTWTKQLAIKGIFK